jgi:transposase
MRRVREIIPLYVSAGLPAREIARQTGIAASTVRAAIKRFQAAGLGWPLPAAMMDGELEAAVYGVRGSRRGQRSRIEPDWAAVHHELKRKHVTLAILWDEYIAQNPDGYRYSWYCHLYRSFAARLPVTMRQSHAAGEKLFVDFAGDGLPVIVDRVTGETRIAQIFVAVMGASNFTYAEAVWTQTLPDFIGCHVSALHAIGGVPHLIVPDNTKTAIIKSCLYDPQVNRTYADMAAHYGAAILPARPRRPRDKAKVEHGVLLVERWLRNRTFCSLAEVNAALAAFMKSLNEERLIRRLGKTRRQLLEEVDRPALKPLPAEPYVFAQWYLRRVGIDYHVEICDHYYSVPFRFARHEVEVRLTCRTVEVFLKGERIAAHPRMSGNHKHTTVPEHMPSRHAAMRAGPWTISGRKRPGPVPRLRRCARRSSNTGRIPSKASAPALACCVSPEATG